MLTDQHESDGTLKRVNDAFSRMHEETARGVRIPSFGVHPYGTGGECRTRYYGAVLEYQIQDGVVFWTYSHVRHWFVRRSLPTNPR